MKKPTFKFPVPVPVLIALARAILDKMTSAASVFPTPPLPMVNFEALIDALEVARAMTVYGGKDKIALRNAARKPHVTTTKRAPSKF